jgi:hypothetical protein
MTRRALSFRARWAVHRWVPLTVGLAVAAITIAIRGALATRERRSVEINVENVALRVRDIIVARTDGHMLPLLRMATRIATFRWISLAAWGEDARLYVRHDPAYDAVAILNPSLSEERVAVRPGGDSAAVIARLGSAREAIRAAAHEEDLRLIRTVSRGEPVLLAVAASGAPSARSIVVAVLNPDTMFGQVINSIVGTGYVVTITDGGDTLFRRGAGQPLASHAADLTSYGARWRLAVGAGRSVVAAERSALPDVVLALGLLMAALLAMVAALGQRAYVALATTEAANTSLRLENVRRHQSEARLAASEAKLAGILYLAHDAVIAANERGTITIFNSGAERVFGYRPDEVIGHSVAMLLPESDRDAHRAHLAAFAGGPPGARVMAPHQQHVFGQRKDGTEVPLECSISKLAVGDEIVLHAAVRDLTDRLAMETQLRQAQKLQAVGQLAGGIAHDFNNVLTIIQTATELVAQDLPQEARGADFVRMAHQASQRGRDLVRKLMAFSRQEHLAPHVLDLNDHIRDFSKLARRVLREDVALEVELAAKPALMLADPVALDQILLNLMTNARDAMSSGGLLTVRTERRAAADGGAEILVHMADTGIGMDAATQQRAFEPFFTTKAVGQGTGLGMAMVYGLMQDHGGSVEIASQPRAGTTVTLRFPAAADSQPDATEPVEARPRGGSETILLVEDDPNIRVLTARTFERAGYTVHMAADGVEALAQLGAPGIHADLIVTDVIMPRMTGPELIAALDAAGQCPRVLYISGYHDGQHARRAAMKRHRLIEKPWAAESLLRAAREVLDTPRAARNPEGPHG